jgi:16S rRNA (cytosine967-C5)-methyltransferase
MGLAAAAGRPGEAARKAVLDVLGAVLRRRKTLDDGFEGHRRAGSLAARDRAFVHALTATALRRKGEIDAVLGHFLTRKLPRSAGTTDLILLAGAAQLLFMDVPAHAAIDLAVTLAERDPDARHFAKLVNAVLRRVAVEGAGLLPGLDAPRLDTPDWLWRRWLSAYGDARAIAAAHLEEPPLDLSAKGDAAQWAERLGGILLPTGTIRIKAMAGAIEELPGYRDGTWWVQDAAAKLPALLLGDVANKRVLDLCAAPGGKTAALAAAGAHVTALDRSPPRMERLSTNLARLTLKAETVIADALDYAPEARFDCVLLDAPCSATGTIRRHPDLPHIKDETQIAALASLQTRLLDHAASLMRESGMIVYCTCSLEPEEGEMRVARFLEDNRGFARLPVTPAELAGARQFINADGDLRTHPAMTIGGEPGFDGFFAARVVRR